MVGGEGALVVRGWAVVIGGGSVEYHMVKCRGGAEVGTGMTEARARQKVVNVQRSIRLCIPTKNSENSRA